MINSNDPFNNAAVFDEDKGNEIVKKLEELGYFKYVEQEKLEKARERAKKNLQYGTISTFGEDEHGNSTVLDKRNYNADQEDLAEGSVGAVINEMEFVLKREGIHCINTKDDTDGVNYFLELNGKNYVIFNANSQISSSVDFWIIAHKRLIEIVNELLVNVNSPERLYGKYGGNDGQVVLLTNELYDYIKSLGLNIREQFYTSEELATQLS